MTRYSTRIAYVAGICLLSMPAYAIFNITSPDIKKGVLGIESRNRWDFDDRASKDNFKMHALKLDYGITDRFAVEMLGYMQDIPQHGYEYTSTEFEGKFRFYDPGEYWLDFALKLSYEWKQQDTKADQGKAKFLFSKDFGKWVHVANANFSKEIGTDASKDTELSLAWRTKYKLNKHFEPGFEYYNGLGELSDMQGYDEQTHRIGPMMFGQIVPGLKYQAGYLFGLSDAAEDGSFKFFLRYEIPL